MTASFQELNSDNRALNKEIILFGIAILFGGNPITQNDFLDYFIKDRENTFLINLHKNLELNFSSLKKSMEKKNKNLLEKYHELIDKNTIVEERKVEENNFTKELIDLGYINNLEDEEEEHFEYEKIVTEIKNSFRYKKIKIIFIGKILYIFKLKLLFY